MAADRSRRLLTRLFVLVAAAVLAALALAKPRIRDLWPEQPAQRWFRSASGHPIALDEPPLRPASATR